MNGREYVVRDVLSTCEGPSVHLFPIRKEPKGNYRNCFKDIDVMKYTNGEKNARIRNFPKIRWQQEVILIGAGMCQQRQSFPAVAFVG